MKTCFVFRVWGFGLLRALSPPLIFQLVKLCNSHYNNGVIVISHAAAHKELGTLNPKPRTPQGSVR
jgi:hypothetical protein